MTSKSNDQEFVDPVEKVTTEEDEKSLKSLVNNKDDSIPLDIDTYDFIMALLDDTTAEDKFNIYLEIAKRLYTELGSGGYVPSPSRYNLGLTKNSHSVSDFEHFRKILRKIDNGTYDPKQQSLDVYGFGGYTSSYNNRSLDRNISKKKESLKDMTFQANYVEIKFSTRAILKIYYMMVAKPNIEWSAYLAYKEILPDYNTLIRDKMTDKKETIIIKVDDVIMIPQKTGGAHVEGMEIEYPEFMHFETEARNNGYRTTGRIHSHNNMSSFHSGTDKDEFRKNFEIGQRFFSLVVSNKTKMLDNIPLEQVVRNWDNVSKIFYDKFDWHILVGIPHQSDEVKDGIIVSGKIHRMAHGIDDWTTEMKRAHQFVITYDEMMEAIKSTEEVFSLLQFMVKEKKLDDREVAEMRKMMFGDKIVFNTITQMTRFMKAILDSKRKAVKEYNDLKDKVVRLGKVAGLVEPAKPKPSKPKVKATVVNSPSKKDTTTTSKKDDKEGDKKNDRKEEKRKPRAEKKEKNEGKKVKETGTRTIIEIGNLGQEFLDKYNEANMIDVDDETGDLMFEWKGHLYPIDPFQIWINRDSVSRVSKYGYPNLWKHVIITFVCWGCKSTEGVRIRDINLYNTYRYKCQMNGCGYRTEFTFHNT